MLARTIALTGARVSEALAITPARCQVREAVIALITLKRRRTLIREVPIPSALMRDLDAEFEISAAQRDPDRARSPLWRLTRVSAYRIVHAIALKAGAPESAASPRGLRHGFCVNSLQSGVPITLVQRWAGHARLSTTALYLNVAGAEERFFAERFWKWSAVFGTMREAA